MNTDNVNENNDQNLQEIGESGSIQPSGITANPANTDFFVENIDTNVQAIAETLDATPFEVTANPANTDFFVENIAKNVDLIKDSIGGGSASPSVVQTTGQSTTDVMSQKAVTDELGSMVEKNSFTFDDSTDTLTITVQE